MSKCKCCGRPVVGGLVLHSECYAKLTTRQTETPTPTFTEGEYIIYQNGDSFEIGKIKRVVEDGAFVWYHSGDTAAKTPFDCMHKLRNAYVLVDSALGKGEHNASD